MKKFYRFLILLILGILLVGCTSSESSKKEDKKTESTKKSKKKKKDKTKDEDKEETEETKKLSSKNDIPLKNYTAIDNENYSLTINDIEKDEFLGYIINVTIENKSADNNYEFTSSNGTVNGLEVEALLYAEVSPGKKSNTTIAIGDLEQYGVEKYTDIKFIVSVGQGGEENFDVTEETVHIYPYGEENATQFVREAKDTDQILMDNEYATIIFIGDDKEDFYGYGVDLYLVNKTDKSIDISANSVSVSGYMADPYYFATLSPGGTAFSRMSWSESVFEGSNIDESNISNIEFTLAIYESNVGEQPLVTEKITITP